MEFIMNLVQGITAVVCIASIVTASTPTPKDDAWIGKLYKLIDLAALNFGFAKQQPGDDKVIK